MVDYVNFTAPLIERGENGGFRTSSLFYEMAKLNDQVQYAKYTLLENEIEVNGIVYPSAYQVILNSDSEYDAAIRLLGSYRHWERMKESNPVWRDGLDFRATIPLQTALSDMHRRIQALGARTLINAAVVDGNVNAAKQLIDGSETKKNKKTPKPSQKSDKAKADVLDMANRFASQSSLKGG